MRLKKIDSQKVNAVLTVKAILFVGMVYIAESNAIYVNLAERLLLISHTPLHIIARSLSTNGLPILSAWLQDTLYKDVLKKQEFL